MTTHDRNDARPANGLAELRARYAGLLDALRNLVEKVADAGWHRSELDEARAAIARAEGR